MSCFARLVHSLSLIMLAVAFCPAGALAAPARLSVSLPAGPYYRPGKYIPVRLTADIPDKGDFWVGLASDRKTEPVPGEISGLGAGRTSVPLSTGKLDTIVPWLVMDDRATRPRVFIEYRPEEALGEKLVRLEDDQRLVGWITPDPEAAAKILGGGEAGSALAAGALKIIPVTLDPFWPLAGHPAAWEVLDLLMLDSAAAARLDASQVAVLLGAGVTIAVKCEGGQKPPLPNWPWVLTSRDGLKDPRAAAVPAATNYFVLRHRPAGPGPGYFKDALAPVSAWEPGWPWILRRRLLILAAAVCLPLLGLMLWRPPLLTWWILGYVAVAMTALGKWQSMHALISHAAAEVIVVDRKLTQTDTWAFQSATRARWSTLRWQHLTRPVFISQAGMDAMWMSVNCDATGRPYEIALRLMDKSPVAFLSRSVGPRPPMIQDVTTQDHSPIDTVLEPYLADGGTLAGHLQTIPAATTAVGYLDIMQWGSAVVDRRSEKSD